LKRLRQLYFLLIFASFLVAALLIWWFLPGELYVQSAIIVLIPLFILIAGFRIITHKRTQSIRDQLFQIFQTLEEFDIDEPNKVDFKESSFPVFNELNEYLIELIDRIRMDYQANKQFTQNASHELQTPLAIIKGHIELLLQSPNIGEKEIESLAIVLQNTNRLSKINSALILLSKIEHHRFIDTEMVDFTQKTNEVLQNFKDLIHIRDLKLKMDCQGRFEVEISTTLAEILIANLVQNAIRHNTDKGFIDIKITADRYTISNPGKLLDVKPEALFKRFLRKSDAEESLGLGLSIVQRICEHSELKISYIHQKGLHSLQIERNQ
jgi:signal transduction histidine kinase